MVPVRPAAPITRAVAIRNAPTLAAKPYLLLPVGGRVSEAGQCQARSFCHGYEERDITEPRFEPPGGQQVYNTYPRRMPEPSTREAPGMLVRKGGRGQPPGGIGTGHPGAIRAALLAVNQALLERR